MASDPEASLRFQSRWSFAQGLGQRSGKLELRILHPKLAALRWTWPSLPLLPEAQVLLFDGGQVLGWTEPEGVASPLDPDSRFLRPIVDMGPGFLQAFFMGQGLEVYFTDVQGGVDRGWVSETGKLGGDSAQLLRSGSKAHRLIWRSSQGLLDCSWESQLSGRRIRLDIRLEDGGRFSLVTKRPKEMSFEPQDLFFQK
ncbi:hypothetical protein H8E52_03100 [bacterium]|nr:hypothetical protein [bacterium]